MRTENRSHETGRIQYVVGGFDNVERFEDAVDILEMSGFLRGQISMIASRDAVETKLSQHYRPAGDPYGDGRLPHILFTERHDIVEGPVLAIGMPVYIGGTVNGQPVVATGGALAQATLLAAAEYADHREIGTIFGQVINDHYAGLLHKLLAQGQLLLGLDAVDQHEQDYACYLLKHLGAQSVTSHAIALGWARDRENPDRYTPHAANAAHTVTGPPQSAMH